MANFVQWLITALASITAIFIIFALATISIFAVGILFIIILIISLFSRFTGTNLYTTKFMYIPNKGIYPKQSDYE